MAKIAVVRARGRLRVVVRGMLCAADLSRLEHACGRALEQKRIDLELRLDREAGADEPARAFLGRLRDRGATILS